MNDILISHGNSITGLQDLTAGNDPSWVFYLLGKRYGRALSGEAEGSQLLKEINFRRRLSPLIKSLAGLFMEHRQIFENRNTFNTLYQDAPAPDSGVILPKEPVIWIANHAFKDDIAASIVAARRHAYVLFGSLPQFYNSIEGLAAYLNGLVLVNRKVPANRKQSVKKAIAVLENGTDLIVFPEGGWNKTPERLVMDFWPGVYRISRATGAKVVPMAHYIKDPIKRAPDNLIHTVVDDPVSLENMSERSALIYLRDIVATWYYLMMEKYGRSTREEEIRAGSSARAVWEAALQDRVKTAGRYDTEIEFTADYRLKERTTPDQVWQAVADIQTITRVNSSHVANAQQILEEYRQHNFQQRF